MAPKKRVFKRTVQVHNDSNQVPDPIPRSELLRITSSVLPEDQWETDRRNAHRARRVAFTDIEKWVSAFPMPPTSEPRRGRSPAPPPPPSPPPPPPAPPVTEEDERLNTFAASLPFSLTFSTIAYPIWVNNAEKPLKFLPIPLNPLSGVPAIPSELDISFSQIMDPDLFPDTIDGILASSGYSQLSIQKVWGAFVSFTHKNGERQRIAVGVWNIALIARPWAKEVFKGALDAISQDCLCEECADRSRGRNGHGLEVEIVFPQDSIEHKRYTSPNKSFVSVIPKQPN